MHKRTWRLVATAAAFVALTTAAVGCGSDGGGTASSTTKAESSDGGGGSTLAVPGDYETIQEAVDAAKAGDLVLIDEGTYNEAVDVTTPDITIRARRNLIDRKCLVTNDGGGIEINWDEATDHVIMTGPIELEYVSDLP